MLSKDLIDAARRQLYSAVISDVLDSLGDLHHAMALGIRPLDDSLVLFGRARTGLYMSVYEANPNINPYELEIALVDSLAPGDVSVLACPSGNRAAAVRSRLTSCRCQKRPRSNSFLCPSYCSCQKSPSPGSRQNRRLKSVAEAGRRVHG